MRSFCGLCFLAGGVFSALCAGCRQAQPATEITWFTTDISRRKNYTQEAVPPLESMPDEIRVSFSENPVSAKGPYPPTPSGNGWYYTRDYNVAVESAAGELKIKRWGVLELEAGRWKHAPFSTRDFEEAFACPGGILSPSQEFTFEQAHQVGTLPGKVRWYFIAVDENGNLTKGEALVKSTPLDSSKETIW